MNKVWTFCYNKNAENADVCRDQKLALGIFLQCSPPSILTQDLWLNPELAV